MRSSDYEDKMEKKRTTTKYGYDEDRIYKIRDRMVKKNGTINAYGNPCSA